MPANKKPTARTAPKKPRCEICYDKGFATVLTGGGIVRGDFLSDPDWRVPVVIEKKYCNCAFGRRLRHRDKN